MGAGEAMAFTTLASYLCLILSYPRIVKGPKLTWVIQKSEMTLEWGPGASKFCYMLLMFVMTDKSTARLGYYANQILDWWHVSVWVAWRQDYCGVALSSNDSLLGDNGYLKVEVQSSICLPRNECKIYRLQNRNPQTSNQFWRCWPEVVAKWLDQRPCNLEVLSSNPTGARAFSSSSSSINGRVFLIRSLKRGASLLCFLFPIILIAVLPEAKQA